MKTLEKNWIYIFVFFALLACVFGGCSCDSPSDMNGVNCVLILSGKSDECIVIKQHHMQVYQHSIWISDIDYYTFPKGSDGYNAFKNYSQGDTIK